MNLTIEAGVSGFAVFLQGLFSFFSPCILPLVPLYIGYLAGGTQTVDEEGNIHYPRKKVLINTCFFILGISFAFILLGIGFSALGRFFQGNKLWFVRIGGILMILFGMYQLGVFGQSVVMERERRLPFHLDRFAMNPLAALALGFTFSFAWTPCVGPTLTSVLLMASSANSSSSGFLLIGVYMLGFVIPFLAVGFFTSTVLMFFRKHQQVIRYTVKLSGILLILMGIMTMTGWMNGVTGYLSSITGTPGNTIETTAAESQTVSETEGATEVESHTVSETEETTTVDHTEETEMVLPDAPDFTLVDQYGEAHTLSEYQGKTVFLNFWATWCGPCKAEMPDIQALYEEYGLNEEELVILGVANPVTEENPYNQDVSEEQVIAFMEENGYTYPVVMDLTGEIFSAYGVSSFPTTFMITKEGKIFGYAAGSLTREMMDSIIEQTITGKRTQ